MQLCQLLVAFSLFVVVTSELVCGIGNFEGSDFVNEHTLNTLLKGIDQALTSDSFQSATSSKSHSKSGSIALTVGETSTAGIAVNKCANTFEYSFVVQLSTDACDGGLVQYYAGLDCATYAGRSPISAVLENVARSKIADVAINCTTAAIATWTPVSTSLSVTALYHEGAYCTGDVIEYRAQAVGTCFPQQTGFASYSCSAAGQPQLNMFDTDLCEGVPTTVTTLTSQCMPVDDLYDFADAPPRAPGAQDATFVGDWAQSVSVRCTGGQ